MTITREDITAFADGQLSPEREAEVAAAVATDPALAQQVAAHRSLKAMLSGHYAPIAEQAVPDRLAAMLAAPREAEVVDFAAAKERREERRRLPRWTWVAGPALAASLALAVILPRGGGEEASPYADAQLASVLDNALVVSQSRQAETRVLLSFRDDADRYCRAFTGTTGGGIACRDAEGWKLEAVGEGSEASTSDYRMAGADDAEILARAQEMAAGPALNAGAEAEAKEKGWR